MSPVSGLFADLADAYAQDEAGCWYSPAAEAFAYSDGAATEQKIERAVRACGDRSVLSMELRAHIDDWPSRYHLSPVRANLLRPVEGLLRGADVLEIGAGCGALTRFIGESGARSVVALEGSRQRARIAALRCAGLDNVVAVADTLQSFGDHRRFDVVTLIGVLEYARIHFRCGLPGDPVDHMLRAAAACLRPGGVLVVAIENQFGLKYFCGFNEDHVAAPYFGIEDQYRPDGVVTFGRRELRERIEGAGLPFQRWLFPFPDYKLPCAVLSEAALDRPQARDLSPILQGSVVADPQTPQRKLFSLEQAWGVAYRNGIAGELANSFLVLASSVGAGVAEASTARELAAVYAVERRPCFAKRTAIVATATGVEVVAERIAPHAPAAAVGLRQVLEPLGFQHGRLWHATLPEILSRAGWSFDELQGWVGRWIDALPAAPAEAGAALPPRYWDAIPKNLIVSEEGDRFIDLEWILSGSLPFEQLFYRGVLLSLLAVGSVAPPQDGRLLHLGFVLGELFRAFGLDGDEAALERLHAVECAFQRDVNGVGWIGFAEVMQYRLPLVAERG